MRGRMQEKRFKRTWYHGVVDGKPHYEEVELTEAEIAGLEKQRAMRLARAAGEHPPDEPLAVDEPSSTEKQQEKKNKAKKGRDIERGDGE